MKNHYYKVDIKWTGNSGKGTANYTAYERSHIISANGKAIIHGSSDPSFRGDNTMYNPEELFVASISPATCFGIYIFVQKQALLLLIMQIMQREQCRKPKMAAAILQM